MSTEQETKHMIEDNHFDYAENPDGSPMSEEQLAELNACLEEACYQMQGEMC